MTSVVAELDFIEELRLRRWARENYVPQGQRQTTWHPVVHQEMEKKDHEEDHKPSAVTVYATATR
jgi:hypothetical protein